MILFLVENNIIIPSNQLCNKKRLKGESSRHFPPVYSLLPTFYPGRLLMPLQPGFSPPPSPQTRKPLTFCDWQESWVAREDLQHLPCLLVKSASSLCPEIHVYAPFYGTCLKNTSLLVWCGVCVGGGCG